MHFKEGCVTMKTMRKGEQGMSGRKMKQKNTMAACSALFLGISLCLAGCQSKPTGGQVTPLATPTGAAREDIPTISPTGAISGVPTVAPTGSLTLKPEPTEPMEMTPTPEVSPTPEPTGGAEATAAPRPTIVPEPTRDPEATPTPGAEPTGVPGEEVTPAPEPTEVPGGDGETTPNPTGTPEPTEIPEPTEEPDVIDSLPDAEEEAVDTDLLLQYGWQYTEDFFGEAKVYFPGRFTEAEITADADGYRCNYSAATDPSVRFVMEGLLDADLTELVLALQEQGAELVRYEKKEIGYRLSRDGKEIVGRIYSCRNRAVMRIELQYNAEDGTNNNVFYVR